MALFVPLDASYAQDPKILDLDDERAELLFIRSLAYCKAHLTDGLVHRKALGQIAPFADEISAGVLAAELVRVGLWADHVKGWIVVAWLDHNPASEDILTSSKGRELAHIRHHVKRGVLKDGCPLCFPSAPADPQVNTHDACADAMRDAQDAMPEPQPHPQPEPSSKPASQLPVVARAKQAAVALARRQIADRVLSGAIGNPEAVATKRAEEDLWPALGALLTSLAEQNPAAGADELATLADLDPLTGLPPSSPRLAEAPRPPLQPAPVDEIRAQTEEAASDPRGYLDRIRGRETVA